MRTQSNGRSSILCLAALSVVFVLAVPTFAQAWVPLQGEGTVSTTYSNMYVRNHVTFDGTRNPNGGRVRTNMVLTSLDVGVTDKLALVADIAYVASKYIGTVPHGPKDTGTYHPTFQDWHLELRYNLLDEALVVTPFIGTIGRTHDYETRGHSAVGRGFQQLLLGASVGRQLDGILRNSYVQGRYSYAILPRFEGLKLDRSNVDCEAGWAATRRLSFRFISLLQKSHGGVITPLEPHLDQHEREFHDRITRTDYLYLGGGVAFVVNKSIAIHGAYLTTVYARNVQAPGGLLVGVSWSFSRGVTLRPTTTTNLAVQSRN
jgi:hypothetical protein